MSDTKAKMTKSEFRDRLTTRYECGGRTLVMLDEDCIGSIVEYGKRVGMSRSRVRTVYGSRVYGSPRLGSVRIEEEAGSRQVLLDKVAAALARSFKEGKIAMPSTSFAEDEADRPPSPRMR